MPPSSSAAPDKILEYTVVAANGLQQVARLTRIPFLDRICTLALTIIPMIQNTKFQKERCLRIVEDIHHFLSVLMNLSVHSEDIQSPKMLTIIAQYALTLQKIDSCLRMQQELGTIKRLFKQSELVTQLDTCETELKTALEKFTVRQGVGLASALVEFNIDTESRHQQLLELISTQSDSVDTLSFIGRSSLNSSSGSFSLLPASPQIFHGRESELQDLMNTLLAEPARVAILGPGGMGKTSLAVAALHSPKVVDKYPTRHFIPCDSAQTNDALVATIASNLGLEVSQGSARHIIHHLTKGSSCLLILDNFETPWEPEDGRATVEEFLALLADIPHVGLLITMRGAERPSKVQWTHPFLRPLSPLSPSAAHQTFIEIADGINDISEVDQLLEITDNIPLAVQLVANVAASKGVQATLDHWKIESTALLSAGCNKRSNLELSIKLSLSSPRLASLPHAVDLLSLMALLSDGISDTDLTQSRPPIPEILKCKTTLIRTSLAYVDHAGRLKVLAPIRDYMQITRPPSPHLVHPLRKHFNNLLKLWKTVMNSSSVGDLTPHLLSNLGNMHNILLYGLDCDPTDIGDTIQAIMSLNQLNMLMHRGLPPLMWRLKEMLPHIDDPRVHGQFILEVFRARWFYAIPNPDKYMDEATRHFQIGGNIEGEAELYIMAAKYYLDIVRDQKKAQNLFHRALTLGCNFAMAQVEGLYGLAIIEYLHGAWSKGLHLGHEIHKIAVAAGNVKGEIYGLQCQARGYMGLGAFKQGMQVVNKGKELVLQAGMQGGSSEFELMNLEGEVCYLKTEYAESRHIREVMLSHSSPILSPIRYAYALVSLVALDLATGASADIVLRNLHTAVDTFRRINYLRGVSICDAHAADLNLRDGDTAGACSQYMHTFTGVYGIDNELACYCLARLADPTHPVHAAPELEKWAVIFLAFVMRPAVRSILPVHQALWSLGGVFARQGANNEALSILTVALEGFTWMDVHQSRAECMQTIGDVHFQQGEISKAFTFWTEARPLFERSSQAKAMSEIDSRLARVAEEEEHHKENVGHLSKFDVLTVSLQQLSISEEKEADANFEMAGAQAFGM